MNTTPSRRTFLQHLGMGVAGLSVAGSLPTTAWATAGSSRLPRSLPEAQGVASAGILDFINAIESGKLSLHSLMVLRHGQVVAEGWWAPYAAGLKHTLYSLSKSFTSTAVGLAAAEGRLRLDDKVVSFFPQQVPSSISPNLAAIRVKDLLMMGAGHAQDPLLAGGTLPQDPDWIQAVLARPVEHKPGSYFTYNNGATYLLSAIVQKLTGQTLLAYLKPRLFEPLGIEDADWETSPQGINCGAWGLRVKTEDIARLGQLYLQKGQWNGQRLLPEMWVDEATRPQILQEAGTRKRDDSDWLQGYGYQFWRCRHDAYRGDGAFGQYCLVLPKQDAVVAITSELGDMQAVLNAVWSHLLPAMRNETLPADGDIQTRLKQKLASLMLPLPEGQPTSPAASRVSGKAFSIADNTLGITRVTMTFEKDQCVFTMHDAQGEHRIACGIGRWLEGQTNLSAVPLKLVPTTYPGEKSMKIACGGAWSDEKTFVMHWRFIETAHYQSVTCAFEESSLRVEFRKSMAILNPATKDSRPVLEGKL